MGLIGGHHITKRLVNELVYFAQNQMSFAKAAEMIQRVYHIRINQESLRAITEDIVERVFREDTERAEKLKHYSNI
ncbi:MAG: hypothetical protein LBI03_06230 [Clostridiales bacterium]|jgi:hypothetical protein|nr:hypothetical protein [Clostridiales bacterium]